MIEAGELTPEDTVVEIGPGFGVLTLAMAPHVQQVIAFEIEKKLEAYWEEQQRTFKNIEIVWGNALKEIGNKKLSAQGGSALGGELGSSYKVLANLPYQITSNVIRTLLELEQKPERIVIMVQKEVAERICAKPGDMSVLAISIQYYGTPNIVTKVTKGNFWPAPKVDSAVVSITNIQDRDDAETFFRYVRAGFQNKRKQLWRNLSQTLHIDGENVKRVLRDVVGDERVRAEDLSVKKWEDVIDRLERIKENT